MQKRITCGAFFLVLLLSFSSLAHAGVTVIQPLRFGEYIVKNNDAVYSISVSTGGTVVYDPAGFVEIAATGQEGIYELDGMTPGTPISSVTITQITPLSGSGPNFQMNGFTSVFPPAVDGTGRAVVRVGATAQTSGSGTPYVDQTFTGQLQIQINF